MKRVLTALVLIPLVLLAVFHAADFIFTALVGIVAILAAIEYFQIVDKYGYRLHRLATLISIALLFAVAAEMDIVRRIGDRVPQDSSLMSVTLAATLLMLFGASLFLAASMREQDLSHALPGAALSLFAIPYVGLSMICLALLRNQRAGWFFTLFTFFAVWVGDTAAYYVGRSMGRTKFAPRISPKKTWEGAIASVVGAMIVGVVFAIYAPHMGTFGSELVRPPIWVPAVCALLINIAAQLGDLFESMIKRGAGVKDSGTMLPGHGGILDRIDALLFAAPVAFVVFAALGQYFAPIVVLSASVP